MQTVALQSTKKQVSKTIELDITPLFRKMGIRKHAKIICNKHTYPLNLADLKNEWIYFAIKGFQKLKAEKQKFKTIAIIGTGSGIDAIAANELFHPETLVITDIHQQALKIASVNFLNNLGSHKPKEFLALKGNLCDLLIQQKIKADLIYANLPNIPFQGKDILEDIYTSTFFEEWEQQTVPAVFREHLLELQYQFLKNAKKALAPKGKILVSVGTRVPEKTLVKLFEKTGLRHSTLVTGLKLQSQADEVLSGYAQAERKFGVRFKFYKYSDQKRSITATQALKLHQQGVPIGHTLRLIITERVN